MKYFNIDSSCKKCRYLGHASVEYKVGVFSECMQEHISTTHITRSDRPIDEYLLRTCQRCGYKWAERTVDGRKS